MISLQGQKLSNQELQKQLLTQVDQYEAAAPQEGRAERAEQALVTLGVYTPAQAQQFDTQVQAISHRLATTSYASAKDAQEALTKQLMAVAFEAKGAQFSSCDGVAILYYGGLAVFFAGLIGSVVVNWDNLLYGDGSFAKDGWMADAGIGGVILGFIAGGISADMECGQ